jgi:hypothetical protein
VENFYDWRVGGFGEWNFKIFLKKLKEALFKQAAL